MPILFVNSEAVDVEALKASVGQSYIVVPVSLRTGAYMSEAVLKF